MELKGIRKCLCCAVSALAVAVTGLWASAQAPSAGPVFEVAAIRQVDPARSQFAGKCFWARVTAVGACYGHMSIVALITHAYDVTLFQVSGPDWANSDHFDIEARFPEGANKKDEPKMLQSLLKDRFKLAFHIEQRELESYVLLVGKHPERLKQSIPDPAKPQLSAPSEGSEKGASEETAKPKPATTKNGVTTLDMGDRGTVTITFDPERWSNRHEYSKITIQQLAPMLSSCMGGGLHDVQDETGLKGNFQVAYDCPLPSRPSAMSTGDASGSLPADPQNSSLLDRSLDAMGLRLEKRKVLRDVYVIDHVEQPSEN